MGIRFERGNRKATNGPLIFFSILHDEFFEEEIRNAFYSGLSFYSYRFPGDSMFSYGSSEGYEEGLGKPGFVIGFFSPQLPFITIPYSGVKTKNPSESLYSMPQVSTPYSDYSMEVEDIINSLKEGKGDKVVAARVEVRDIETDVAEKFYELCEKFPDAFVFCFSTPATGCWIGASPELLLENQNGVLRSMALAGTRQAGVTDPWDHKNIEEQRIVTDYILACFRRNGLEPKAGDTFTKPTGKIEHLCTPVVVSAPSSSFNLENLVRDLSPTPALCGSPKQFALQEISRLEKFDRGCYGGFCGPFRSADDFHFQVVLRCATVAQQRLCIYVGGGITSHSEVASEWEETEMKIKNIFGN